MTASPGPHVGLPSDEEIARWLCKREGFDPDIKASHVGDALLWSEWLPDARALLSLIRPAFEAQQAKLAQAVEALERLDRLFSYPVAREINPRGYDIRGTDADSVEFAVEIIRAAILALAEGKEG